MRKQGGMVVCLQTKEKVLRRNQPCWIIWSQTSILQTCEKINACCLSPLSGVFCYAALADLYTTVATKEDQNICHSLKQDLGSVIKAHQAPQWIWHTQKVLKKIPHQWPKVVKKKKKSIPLGDKMSSDKSLLQSPPMECDCKDSFFGGALLHPISCNSTLLLAFAIHQALCWALIKW